MKENKNLLKKTYNQGCLSDSDFVTFMQNHLVSKDGYVLETGGAENVNAEVALRLEERIKKHPLLWKLFMVA